MQPELNYLILDLHNKLDVLTSKQINTNLDVLIRIDLKSCLESIVYYVDLLNKNPDNECLRQIVTKSASKLAADLERHFRLQ